MGAMSSPMSRVPPLAQRGDAQGLVDEPKKQQDQSDEVVMRQLRELTEQVDSLTRQYPKTGKNAQVAKKALMAMMRDILENPTQPGEAQAPRIG